jgi:GGDEF domain-containing protein/DICT domain-containing protein
VTSGHLRTLPRVTTADGTSVLSKRLLVEVSHAIERFALAAEPGAPLVVIALFQKLSYFEREVAVYADIAGRSAVTIVGLAEDFPPTLPEGVRHTLFGPGDPLAREWSVNVLGPGGGASLVAIDQETVAPDAPTLEQGRQFRGRWSFRREDAYREVLRLRSQMRLPASTVADIDAVLQAVVEVPERATQWWDVPLRFLADRLGGVLGERDRANVELDVAQQGSGQRDPRTGLLTTAYLERWTRGLGEGTLPVGLVLLRLHDVEQVRTKYGMRVELATLQTVARILHELTGDADRVIRVDRADFLLVLPGRQLDVVRDLSRDLDARIAQMDQWYPFVTLQTVVAATVTRRRPLPVGQLLEEVSHGSQSDDNLRLVAG